MQTFTCPAKYRPFVEDAIQQALAEIGRDMAWRDDEDPRIHAWRPVPDGLVDASEGSLVVVLSMPSEVPKDSSLPTHLIALNATGR